MITREILLDKAKELLSAGVADRVLGWTEGEFSYDQSPKVFDSIESLDSFVYDDFCGANLSKYLIEQTRQKHKVVVFLKGCDTFSFNQLLNEKRINRDLVTPIVIGCAGKLDVNKIKERVEGVITSVKIDGDKIIVDTLDGKIVLDDKKAYLLEKCHSC